MFNWLRNLNCFIDKKGKLLTVLLIIFLSFCLTIASLLLTSPTFNYRLFFSYFLNFHIILINMIPIFILLFILYLIISKLWIAYFSTGFIIFTLSYVNQIKLLYRDYPFVFSDFLLINESLEMAKQYELKINFMIVFVSIALILSTIILYFIKTHKFSIKTRIIQIVFMIIVSIILYIFIFTSNKIYEIFKNERCINKWSQTQQFQSRGFIYPFIYSSKTKKIEPPKNYDEEEVIQILNQYEYYDIENKVNIVAIMLEAFNDFSRFEQIEFNIDIYEKWREIYNNSYHGYIVSNVFGGGTIDTERAFLTGNFLQGNYLTPSNSFVYYFKEQGYAVESFHPIYGWFYNRRNININLGFDKFLYYENYYSNIEGYTSDLVFLKSLYDFYKEGSKPYFSFSVTYQNHGPYSEEKIDTEYFKNNGNFDNSNYNVVNNYFDGIYNTVVNVYDFVHYFDDEEPTIIILFGDHNPYLGENNLGFTNLQIDLNCNSIECTYNKYAIPYLFYANNSAKVLLKKDFNEIGNTISPNYLLPELFEYIGYNGNQYMQFITDIKHELPVINSELYIENGKFTKSLEDITLYNKYNSVQYYNLTEFNK